MIAVCIKDSDPADQAAQPGFGAALMRRFVPNIDHGSLTIVLPGERRVNFRGASPGPDGVLVFKRWRALRRLWAGGDLAFAEAYMDGDWSSPDLTALIDLFARNISSIPYADYSAPLKTLMNRLRHRVRANTLPGSRRNIVEHYDIGNDFYAQWLDSGMSYSSALFTRPDMSLEAAQTAKLDRILEMLDLRPGQSVLEIGIGWGGLAERIASSAAHVTGLTLSPAQHAYAVQRLRSTEYSDLADLRLQDYRQVDGAFHRIVSIEMLEAVGEAWWPTYFDTLRSRLHRGGKIVLQTITVADERFEYYRRRVDFIQRYIFPGGMLPSQGALRHEIARAGLRITDTQLFGPSYAETLRHWRQRFEAAWPSIAAMGLPLHFKRMWDYYLAYSEAGFRAGIIDVGLWRLEHCG
jgi:cyclopropane-fatty-acyl-phospholipid synthase